MTKYLFIIFIFINSLFVLNACENETDLGNNLPENNDEISNDFSEREYKLFVPPAYDENTKTPLVMAFHGASSTSLAMEMATGFNAYAENENFIVCYPQALVQNWEEGCECNITHRLGIDDVGFVNYLLDTLSTQYNIDESRIYAVGFSQGGLFVQNLACKVSNRFAAVATVASPMSVPLYNNCSPSEKISMLMIHGTSDQILPFNGLNDGSFSLVSSPAAIAFWADKNGCDPAPQFDEQGSVRKRFFNSCSDGIETVLYEITGGGHSWSISSAINTSEVIIDFLLSKQKQL
jgi:poly(3-hydroxybutyrate) depolymerase